MYIQYIQTISGPNKGHILNKETIMNELWKNLEHLKPNEFTRDDFVWIRHLALDGLKKRYGELTPEFSFLRSEEFQGNPFVTHESGSKKVRIPRLTVCYLRPEGKTAVGMAFCSRGDNPNKWYGRALALKRAVQVVVGRHVTDEHSIREETEFATFLGTLGYPIIVKNFEVSNPEFVIPTTNGDTDE